MVKSFSDLLGKQPQATSTGPKLNHSNIATKPTDLPVEPEAPKKANPFDKLKQQVEKKKTTFNLKNKTTTPNTKSVAPPAPQPAATDGDAGPSVSVSTPVAASPQNSPEEKVAAIREAKEFIHDGQPDEMSKQAVEQLQISLEVLRNSLDHPELVSEALKNLMLDLQEHEFLRGNMAKEDYGLMVRALRVSYGKTIAKKQERSATKTKNSEDVDSIVSMLGDMNFSVGK